MNGDISKKQDCINKNYYILKDNILVEGYEDYPLCLVSFTKDTKEQDIKEALAKSRKYIDYAIAMIEKHDRFSFSEDEIIDFLLGSDLYAFSRELAKNIDDELCYIKEEAPEAFDSFVWTKRFLNHFKGA